MKKWVGSRVKARAKIKELLQDNYKLQKRAILAVYSNQDEMEREDVHNYDRNDIGFDNWQCVKLTKLCKKLLARRNLTGEEQEYLEKQAPRFSRQIFDIGLAQGKIEQLSARRYTFVY